MNNREDPGEKFSKNNTMLNSLGFNTIPDSVSISLDTVDLKRLNSIISCVLEQYQLRGEMIHSLRDEVDVLNSVVSERENRSLSEFIDLKEESSFKQLFSNSQSKEDSISTEIQDMDITTLLETEGLKRLLNARERHIESLESKIRRIREELKSIHL